MGRMTMVKDMETMKLEEALEKINDQVDYLDYETCEVFALRGDDYIPRRKFRKSLHRPDGRKMGRLNGVCGVLVAENAAGGDNTISAEDLAMAITQARQYGKNVYLLKGERIDYGNDEWAKEIILANHKIIGRIDNND